MGREQGKNVSKRNVWQNNNEDKKMKRELKLQLTLGNLKAKNLQPANGRGQEVQSKNLQPANGRGQEVQENPKLINLGKLQAQTDLPLREVTKDLGDPKMLVPLQEMNPVMDAGKKVQEANLALEEQIPHIKVEMRHQREVKDGAAVGQPQTKNQEVGEKDLLVQDKFIYTNSIFTFYVGMVYFIC